MSAAKPRARDIGLRLDGTPGPNNNITDVAGVEIGYSTIVRGEPEDYVSYDSDFVRSGVTAILPRGKARTTVVAGMHNYNGYGELTGVNYLQDYGQLCGPIMLTNTFSVGVVRDAAYKWFADNDLIEELRFFGERVEGASLMYPVVGETYDGYINNGRGFHINADHAVEALESARTGAIAEGNIGGGTGMQCHLFKGGSGSASRKLSDEEGGYTLGVFVQVNHGNREQFSFRSVPLGQLITDSDAILNGVAPGGGLSPKPGTGSIIVVAATDAPLTAEQINKLCKRVPLGIGRLGGGMEDSSGDIFLGFSTAQTSEALTATNSVQTRQCLPHEMLDPLYQAVVEATEESILNAMVAAETMVGINGNTLFALPHDQMITLLEHYRR
jgi:D-aminopeptidase